MVRFSLRYGPGLALSSLFSLSAFGTTLTVCFACPLRCWFDVREIRDAIRAWHGRVPGTPHGGREWSVWHANHSLHSSSDFAPQWLRRLPDSRYSPTPNREVPVPSSGADLCGSVWPDSGEPVVANLSQRICHEGMSLVVPCSLN
jgi:hypothetical protein